MRHGIQALAVLLATSAAHAQVIHACAHKQTGVLRLVADAAECGQNESAASWNREGPTGEKGEPGEPGEQGPAGPSGSSFLVFDANGVELGIYAGADRDVGELHIYHKVGRFVFSAAHQDRLVGVPILVFFEDPECEGQPLLHAYLGWWLVSTGDRYFTQEPNMPSVRRTVHAQVGSGGCTQRSPREVDVVVGREVFLEDFGLAERLAFPLRIVESGGE